jgi:pyruvate kinase
MYQANLLGKPVITATQTYPVHEPEHPEDWRSFIREWLHAHEVGGNIVVLTEGPSPKHPEDEQPHGNH